MHAENSPPPATREPPETPTNHRRGTGCFFGPPLNGRICTCPPLPEPASPTPEGTPQLNADGIREAVENARKVLDLGIDAADSELLAMAVLHFTGQPFLVASLRPASPPSSPTELTEVLDDYRRAVIDADHCYGEGNEGDVLAHEAYTRHCVESLVSALRQQSISPEEAAAINDCLEDGYDSENIYFGPAVLKLRALSSKGPDNG